MTPNAWPEPDRYRGDERNDWRACATGFWWGSWDAPSGRSVTISISPEGECAGAGYTRGDPAGPAVPWGPLDQAARDALQIWLTS